mmetsp:Transcript_20418/g.44222  ORF Transcript_20418/g.44222 Transcript_20418/m.44222 type:complete len:510 (-) Transcript_20418:207-1736(-)|eukprot:CAMPEP_0168733538 /NCGR_PEP_ID=MMETSP0724-20121128/8346_1 /TAXON_ID=265536 /ORGANISM="Amphiprora sp., Strain CCMP467" /LENGTH=509 /DNA_ID=CAMNT_0008780607 /DNA_START=282 /DNA_END=1811 /DNA_ORIENTATION=+
MSLSQEILPQLRDEKKVQTPSYSPQDLSAGILHVGIGNFHRSHMATYMNDLFNDVTLLPENKDWGIVGAGILHFDAAKRDLLESQDWMQTLVQRDANSSQASLIASMIDFLPVDHVKKEHKQLQDMLSLNTGIKIVSLTVTEGGYFLDNGQFDAKHPQIQHDIAHPDAPQTIFGMIVKALKHRRKHGLNPFTVMSCDNIPHNGHVVHSVVAGIAQAQPDTTEFVPWMEATVTFPNSMVDRITPGTTPAMKETVATDYGYTDAAPIFCEPFRQWILEDKFCAGRPTWDKLPASANISFVHDVAPFEWMKIRILNGGHASLCYPAALLNVPYVHDAMLHPAIGPFVDTLERMEIIPTVGEVPNTNLAEYWQLIHGRFSNPTIMDTIGRICYDGASRQPKFIVPVVADSLAKEGAGARVDGLALVSALWCRYCQGRTESGDVIGPNDPQWDRLQGLAEKAKTSSSAWLEGLDDVYGDVAKSPVFTAAFDRALTKIQLVGVEATLQQYVSTYQ